MHHRTYISSHLGQGKKKKKKGKKSASSNLSLLVVAHEQHSEPKHNRLPNPLRLCHTLDCTGPSPSRHGAHATSSRIHSNHVKKDLRWFLACCPLNASSFTATRTISKPLGVFGCGGPPAASDPPAPCDAEIEDGDGWTLNLH